MLPRPLSALIFDLDGVLVDTARAHFAAWKTLADELDIDFDETANEALKGIDRMGSLALILARGDRRYDAAERVAMAERKNERYREAIAGYSPADLFPGARAALELGRAAGLGIALASASRNAPALLERLGIAPLFDAIIDPAAIAQGKPAPDIFLAAATALRVDPRDCLGIEDAAAGVAAIKAAGMTALGIGSAEALAGADRVIASIADFRLADYHAGRTA